MNRFLKASLLSLCLTTVVYAAATDKSKETQTTVSSEATTATVDKSREKRQENREMRKLEKAKKLLETCTAEFKELEAKVATAEESQKKKATLSLAHAKLDLDAAVTSDSSGSMIWLTRQCKRHLSRAKDIIDGKEKSGKSGTTDAKTVETTTPKA